MSAKHWEIREFRDDGVEAWTVCDRHLVKELTYIATHKDHRDCEHALSPVDVDLYEAADCHVCGDERVTASLLGDADFDAAWADMGSRHDAEWVAFVGKYDTVWDALKELCK